MIALIPAVIFCFLTAASAQDCSRNGQFTNSAGSYVFTWSVQSNFDYVDCTVSVDTASNDRWVAVGFSEDQAMPDTDVVIGADDGTNRFVQDRWNGPNRNDGPSLDPMQNINNTSTMRNGNRLTISFTRPLVTPDTIRDENLTECRYVLWAFGGTTTFTNGDVTALGGHSNRGVFPNQLCLCTSGASVGAVVSLAMMIVAVLLAAGGSIF